MANENKKVAIVCNPRAGRGTALEITENIIIHLKQKEISYSLFTAHWPQIWNGCTEVWIIGGDGTLNYFINQYPDIQIPLSIFKGGTGNDFHGLVYGSINLEEQIEKVLRGTLYKIDAGICNEKLFLNGVGIGFDGAIVEDLVSQQKSKGKSSYLFSILKNILGYKEKNCLIKFDEQTISQDCFMINVANGKAYGGGFKVAPIANIDDGMLDLNIIGKIKPYKRLYYIPVIKKGEHLKLSFVQYHQTNKVEIKSPFLLPAHIDGEYFTANEFVVKCLPKRFSFLW